MIRNIILLIIGVIIMACQGQNLKYFSIQKVNCNILGQDEGYKIVFKEDSTTVCSYNIESFANIPERNIYEMVEELLGFQGDTALCVLKISNYNPLKSQFYTGQNKRYTLQLEALFIINQLSIASPFNYSSYPLLYNKKTGQFLYGTEEEMKNIYKLYHEWLVKIKKIGLKEANRLKLNPLEGSIYKWY